MAHGDVVSLLRKNSTAILAEFMSTGLLVLLGCMGCVPFGGVSPSHLQIVLGFGFVIMFNIQIFGHVSGAHMNPTVTTAALVMGATPPLLALAYVAAQLAGGVLGFGLLTLLTPAAVYHDRTAAVGLCTTMPHSEISLFQAVIVEGVISAILVWLTCVLCFDPVNKNKTENISIKFGLTIVGLCIVGGPFTGASMNPARSLGPAVWNRDWQHHWIYWLGPLSSAIISSFIYKYLFLTKVQDKLENPPEEVPLSLQEKSAGGAA